MDLSPTDTQRVLACLGDPSRFRMVALLAEGDRCVTDIAREVQLSQSCTTRHLQVLLRHAIVSRARQGKRVLFRLRDDTPDMASLLEWTLIRSRADVVLSPRQADVHRDRPADRVAGYQSRARKTGKRYGDGELLATDAESATGVDPAIQRGRTASFDSTSVPSRTTRDEESTPDPPAGDPPLNSGPAEPSSDAADQDDRADAFGRSGPPSTQDLEDYLL